MTPNHEFKALDVSSLYPSSLINDAFPVGKPFRAMEAELREHFVIKEEGSFFKNQKVLGCLQVRVVCPKTLEYPFLAIPTPSGPIFSQCYKCAVLRKASPCPGHQDTDRSFEITLTTGELEKAISLGYKICRAFEALLYTRSEKIFAKFMSVLAREKVRLSPIPMEFQGCPEEYAVHVNSELGLSGSRALKSSDFECHPIRRYLIKLSMVSVAGKFLQRSETAQKFVSCPEEVYRQYVEKNIVNIDSFNEESCLVTLRKRVKKFYRARNMLCGAMVIANGRILAYDYWCKLRSFGVKVFYHDVDSFFGLFPKALSPPFTFSQVPGFLHMEFQTSTIVAFVALGPKSYALLFKEKDGRLSEKCCCCGLSVSSDGKKILSFDLYKQHLDSFIKDCKAVTLIPQKRKRLLLSDKWDEDKIAQFSQKFTVFSFSCNNMKKRYIDFSSTYLDTFSYGHGK